MPTSGIVYNPYLQREGDIRRQCSILDIVIPLWMAGDFRKDLSGTTDEQDYNFATSLKDDPENTLKTLIAAQFSSRNQLRTV